MLFPAPQVAPLEPEGFRPVGKRLINVKRLRWRLRFEKRLVRSVVGILAMFVLMICLMTGLAELQPSKDYGLIHEGLRKSFSLETAEAVTDFHGVYDFAAAFAERGSRHLASSGNYWCEKRYFSLSWDDRLGAPVRVCDSPREHAVGVPNRPTWHPRHDKDNSSLVTCSDNETALRISTGVETASCASFREIACSQAETARHCRRTCKYCGPFEYEMAEQFVERHLAVMPAVVLQTRWLSKVCEGVSDTYNKLAVVRTLDGMEGKPSRGYSAMSCRDWPVGNTRSQPVLDKWSEHAQDALCPVGSECASAGGDRPVSFKKEFDGLPVYPELLANPGRDVARLRNRGWLDSLTESVTVSSLVYTEELEIYTYFGVEFKVDLGGGIQPRVITKSYRELDSYTFIVARLITALLIAVVGVLLVALAIARDHDTFGVTGGWRGFEALVLVGTVIYIMVALVQWSQQPLLANAYNKLLRSFVDIASNGFVERRTGHDGEVIDAFFVASEELISVHNWQLGIRIGGYVVLHALACQVVLYLGVHPRARFVASVVTKGLGEVMHAGGVFLVLFVFMAACAQWLFGPWVEDYETFSAALTTQLRWLFGRTWADPLVEKRLSGVRLVMWKVYALIFLVLAFWTVLMVLAAISYEALSGLRTHRWRSQSGIDDDDQDDGQKWEDETACAGNFFWDIYDSCRVQFYLNWRVHSRLLAILQTDTITKKTRPITLDELQDTYGSECSDDIVKGKMPEELGSPWKLDEVAAIYEWKCPGLLLPLPAMFLKTQSGKSNQIPMIKVLDEVPEFVEIDPKALSLSTQENLRRRVEKIVIRWLNWAPKVNPDYEELAPTMACSVVQEVLYTLLEAELPEDQACELQNLRADSSAPTPQSNHAGGGRPKRDEPPPIGLVIQDQLPPSQRLRSVQEEETVLEDVSDESSVVSDESV